MESSLDIHQPPIQPNPLYNSGQSPFLTKNSDVPNTIKEQHQENDDLKSMNKVSEEEKIKNEKIEKQMKLMGFDISGRNLSRDQFTKTLSNAIGNFFNPLINMISTRERQVCLKLGLKVQKQEDRLKNKTKEEINKQSKLQSNIDKEQRQLNSKGLLNQEQKRKFIQQLKVEQQKEAEQRPKEHNLMKRRIIRKIGETKPAPIKRNHEEKVLVKQMEENFDCKLKNNRLYMKGMPKKPVSSFFFFFKDYSKKIQAENQQLQVSKQLTYGSALAKRISKRWRQMTNEQKIPYKMLSMTTREAYQKSMEQFKNQNKQVFDSFKKIKRIKANETRRIKIQKDSQDDDIEAAEEENSESEKIQTPSDSKNDIRGNYAQPIDLQNEDLPIMIPQEEEQGKRKRPPPQRHLRQRFKSIHKPKSPSPSFFFYYNQKKGEISKEHGVTRGAKITQIASGMWRQMSEEEKLPYQSMANQRRKQYYEEMKRFEIDHPEEWTQMLAHRRRVTGGLIAKKTQDQLQQKQNKSGKQCIEEENSESLQDERNVQVDSLEGIVIDRSSKKIKTNQNQKVQKSHLLNVQQKAKPQVNNTSNHSENFKSDVKNRSSRPTSRTSNKNQNEKNQKPQEGQNSSRKDHRPKAPVSSFFMFYRENNSLLANQFKETNGGKLVQYASEIWRNMTDAEKKPYQIQAEESRERYYKEMDQYKDKYPQEIKQRKIDLKKKHSQQSENPSKSSRSRKKPQKIEFKENKQEEGKGGEQIEKKDEMKIQHNQIGSN